MKLRIQTLLAGVLLALILSGVAAAGQLEDGLAAFERYDYATAERVLRPLAEQGNDVAQLTLGKMYWNQGMPDARKWLGKAADQGSGEAQFDLGLMCASGPEDARDYAQAAIWYRKAADQGYADGQIYLGMLYDEGLGVPQSDVQAYMWLNLGVSRTADARWRKMYIGTRDRVAAKMTPEQIAEAQKLAIEWKPSK